MSAPENFGQDDPFFASEFGELFDADQQPGASEQVDSLAPFTASSEAYREIELEDPGFVYDYTGNVSMVHEPTSDLNTLPQTDNFQGGLVETLDFGEALDVALTGAPNPNILPQYDSYAFGETFLMPDTVCPSTAPMFSEEPPVAATGQGVYGQLPPQEHQFYQPTVGPEMLQDTSAGVPPPPPAGTDGGNLEFYNIFPQGFTSSGYPPDTTFAPPASRPTSESMQASNMQVIGITSGTGSPVSIADVGARATSWRCSTALA